MCADYFFSHKIQVRKSWSLKIEDCAHHFCSERQLMNTCEFRRIIDKINNNNYYKIKKKIIFAIEKIIFPLIISEIVFRRQFHFWNKLR